MSDDYRDPLTSALSRIEALERENAALKNAQSGRPATAAELEAVRLDNELLRVDMQWEPAKRQYAQSGLDEKSVRASWALTVALPLVLVSLGAVFALGVGSGALSPIILAAFCGLGAFMRVVAASTFSRFTVERTEHDKRREILVLEIARLRRQPARVGSAEPARIRVPEPEPTSNGEAPSPATHEKRR